MDENSKIVSILEQGVFFESKRLRLDMHQKLHFVGYAAIKISVSRLLLVFGIDSIFMISTASDNKCCALLCSCCLLSIYINSKECASHSLSLLL